MSNFKNFGLATEDLITMVSAMVSVECYIPPVNPLFSSYNLLHFGLLHVYTFSEMYTQLTRTKGLS